MDFVYGKCKFNYLPKKVEPESRGFEKVIDHKTKRHPFGCLFVLVRKQEGFEPVRAWENTWIDKTEGLCQPL